MTTRLLLAAGGVVLLLVSNPAAAPDYSEWSAPVNLGALVNSAAADAGVAVSKKGTSLYFNSNRLGGVGGNDIWVSQRDSPDDPWGLPVNLGAVVNAPGLDASPALSRDEHWLFFQSIRPGGLGGIDVWASYREHVHDDFGWQTPVNLLLVNSASDETVGGYFANDGGRPQLYISSNRPGGQGLQDVYVSEELLDGSFNIPSLVPELNSSLADPGAMIRFDGLEAFVYSTRPGVGATDMWVARRASVLDAWSTPQNLGTPLNSTLIDQRPYIAADRKTLYFASDRPGGLGGLDLYVTTRGKE